MTAPMSRAFAAVLPLVFVLACLAGSEAAPFLGLETIFLPSSTVNVTTSLGGSLLQQAAANKVAFYSTIASFFQPFGYNITATSGR